MQDINTLNSQDEHELSTADRYLIAGRPHCPSLIDDEACWSGFVIIRPRLQQSGPATALSAVTVGWYRVLIFAT